MLHVFCSLSFDSRNTAECDTGARGISSPAPVRHDILLSPALKLQADADTALRAAASQDLAAVGGSHTLTETVHLGAMTLLGLIGTNHADTSYIVR